MYGMFSIEGELALVTYLAEAIPVLKKDIKDPKAISEVLKQGLQKLEGKFPEVFDTMVREQVEIAAEFFLELDDSTINILF